MNDSIGIYKSTTHSRSVLIKKPLFASFYKRIFECFIHLHLCIHIRDELTLVSHISARETIIRRSYIHHRLSSVNSSSFSVLCMQINLGFCAVLKINLDELDTIIIKPQLSYSQEFQNIWIDLNCKFFFFFFPPL